MFAMDWKINRNIVCKFWNRGHLWACKLMGEWKESDSRKLHCSCPVRLSTSSANCISQAGQDILGSSPSPFWPWQSSWAKGGDAREELRDRVFAGYVHPAAESCLKSRDGRGEEERDANEVAAADDRGRVIIACLNTLCVLIAVWLLG
nr:hypothetical protein Iba_chr03bCG7530 [Ipomoea batatas]